MSDRPMQPPEVDVPHSVYESEQADRRTARIGLLLFSVYLAVYALFVALCAFARETMGHRMLGINLAILYGLVLIIFPFALAGLYLRMTRRRTPSLPAEGRA